MSKKKTKKKSVSKNTNKYYSKNKKSQSYSDSAYDTRDEYEYEGLGNIIEDDYSDTQVERGNIIEDDYSDSRSEEAYRPEKTYHSKAYVSPKEIKQQKSSKSFPREFSVLIILLVFYFGFHFIYPFIESSFYKKIEFTANYIKQNPIPNNVIPYIDYNQFEKALLTSDLQAVNETYNYLNDKKEALKNDFIENKKSLNKDKSRDGSRRLIELELSEKEFKKNELAIDNRLERLEKRKSLLESTYGIKNNKDLQGMSENEIIEEVNDYLKGRDISDSGKIKGADFRFVEDIITIAVTNNYLNLLEEVFTKIVDKYKNIDSYYYLARLAVQYNRYDCLEKFIKHGLDLKNYEKNECLIHSAAWLGNVKIAKLLLESGEAIDRWNDNNDTPLTIAIKNDRSEMVEFLISKGALTKKELDIYNGILIKYVSFKNILYYPVKNNNYKILGLLVNNGVSPKEELKYFTNDGKIMQLIVSKLGKNYIDEKQREENVEWKEAYTFIVNNQVDKFKDLEKSGKDFSKMFYEGVPAICLAVNYNRKEIVDFLLKNYDCKNLVDRINGRNALHYAAISSNTSVEILTSLLEAKFNPDSLDLDKNTALNFAVCNKDYDFVKALLNAGADPCILNLNNENSASFYNYLNKKLENSRLMDLLLESIEESLKNNPKKMTPLHFAVLTNNSLLVDYYLKRGANPSIRDIDGNTVLHYVAKYAPNEIMLFFINPYVSGYDFSIKNKEGKTAREICDNDLFIKYEGFHLKK